MPDYLFSSGSVAIVATAQKISPPQEVMTTMTFFATVNPRCSKRQHNFLSPFSIQHHSEQTYPKKASTPPPAAVAPLGPLPASTRIQKEKNGLIVTMTTMSMILPPKFHLIVNLPSSPSLPLSLFLLSSNRSVRCCSPHRHCCHCCCCLALRLPIRMHSSG